MGGYGQSDPLSESLGLPSGLADQIRKRGILPRLVNIGQDENFGSNSDSGTPRLAQLMNQGESGSAPYVGTEQSLADKLPNPRQGGYEEWRHPASQLPARLSPARNVSGMGDGQQLQHRFVDDPVTRNQPAPPPDDVGFRPRPAEGTLPIDFTSQAPAMAQASRASLAQRMQQPEPSAEDSHTPLREQIKMRSGRPSLLEAVNASSPSPSPVADAQANLTKAEQPSGVSRLMTKARGIHNPFLRGLGEVGAGLARGVDVAGSIFAPNAAAMIPGSTLNRALNVRGAQGRLTQAEANAEREAQTGRLEEPEHMETDRGPIQFNRQTRQWEPVTIDGNPVGSKSSLESTAAGRRQLSDQYGLNGDDRIRYILTGQMPVGADKPDLDQQVANRTRLADQQELQGSERQRYILTGQLGTEKPDTATQLKEQFMSITGKLVAEGKLPPGALTDINQLSKAIQQSRTLTPQEKQSAISYLAANSTPAAQGTTTRIRVEGMGQMREYPVINKQTGELEMRSATEINASKGNYAPAGEGAKAMSKKALLEDIRGNVQQVRQSLQNMPEFSAGMKAKIATALRSRDPRSTVSALINGEGARELGPEQQDYLINTSLLIENAMAMRSVLGAGQGSDELRSAIMATIPGPTTPSKGYAAKQLDAFEKVLDRLERGVPGMPLKDGMRQQGGGQGGGQQGITATGPSGHKIVVRGGHWVDASTGQPIQ